MRPASVAPAVSASDNAGKTAPEQAAFNNTATAVAAPSVSGQTYTPYSGSWADGDEYWSKAMEILRAERKNSIASCASNGYVLAYDNKVLTIGFKMKFLCERLQKPDYREIVEEVLLRVARVPVKLQCVVDTGGNPANKIPVKQNAAADSKGVPAAAPTGTPVVNAAAADTSRNPEAKAAKDNKAAAPAVNAVTAPTATESPVAESTKKAMEMFDATLHRV